MLVFINIPKGTRDYNTELAILFKKIVNVIEEIFQKYGFDPIITPIVEYWDVLKGKYGEEAENKEIWRFKVVKSKKEYALRYDLTVPLARFFAKYQPKLPFKRYSIGRVYRYENPQKGRYREFWQADADIVGSKYPEADAEIINMMIEIYDKLGFKDCYFRISDRRALEKVIIEVGEKDKFIEIARIIDKWDKIGREGVLNELKKITNKYEEIINKIEENSEEYYPEDFWKILDFVYNKKKIKIDLKLARGLDYYTGMIYEVWSKDFNRSLGAGGRYDNLIGMFLGKDVPAVGGSIGIDCIIDFGIEHGIFKIDKKTYTEIAIVTIGNVYKKAWEISNKLRSLGFKVYIDLMRRDFRKQIEYVVEKNIKYLVIVGERDLKEGCVTFQNRITGERKKIRIDRIEEIRDLINL